VPPVGAHVAPERGHLVQHAAAVEHANGAERDALGHGAAEEALDLGRPRRGRQVPVERRVAEHGVADGAAHAPRLEAGALEPVRRRRARRGRRQARAATSGDGAGGWRSRSTA
jgi:hypothetical protein